MNIGALTMPDGAALAPMAGVTDMPMRTLCFEQGAAWAVTEMLSAKAAPGRWTSCSAAGKTKGYWAFSCSGASPS